MGTLPKKKNQEKETYIIECKDIHNLDYPNVPLGKFVSVTAQKLWSTKGF